MSLQKGDRAMWKLLLVFAMPLLTSGDVERVRGELKRRLG